MQICVCDINSSSEWVWVTFSFLHSPGLHFPNFIIEIHVEIVQDFTLPVKELDRQGVSVQNFHPSLQVGLNDPKNLTSGLKSQGLTSTGTSTK